jgi:hypothetical protein
VGSGESNSDGRSDNSRIDGENRGSTYSRSVMSSQEGNNNNSSSAVGVGVGVGGSVGVRNESSRGDRYKSNTTATTNTTSGSTGAVGHTELSSKSDAHNTTHSTTQGGSSTLDTYRKNIANSNNNNNSSSSSNLKSASPPFTNDKPLGKTTTSFSTSKNAATNDPTQSHLRDSKNTEMDTGTCMRSTALNLS